MSDLIDRQAAIDEIDEWIKAFRENGHKESAADACLIQDGIIQLPSAQPQRMKGRWYHGDAYPHHLYCSVCYRTALPNDEYVERWNLHMNYCPNCGADMRGEQDGSD